MSVIAALDCVGKSEGTFFWDDGESVDTVKNGQYFSYSFQSFIDFVSLFVLSFFFFFQIST